MKASCKINNWESILLESVELAKTKAFAWGSHDCACWTFGLISKISSIEDFSHLWLGKYKTAMGSVRVMRKSGWDSLFAGASALLGEPLSSVKFAQRGDLMLSEDGDAFGICLGRVSVFLSPLGITHRSTFSCLAVWRI